MKRLVNASKKFILKIIKVKGENDGSSKAFEGGDPKHKSEMVKIISKYDEVLQELTRLAPKRGDQLEIQLQQDVPLTNIGMYRMYVMQSRISRSRSKTWLEEELSSLTLHPVVHQLCCCKE